MMLALGHCGHHALDCEEKRSSRYHSKETFMLFLQNGSKRWNEVWAVLAAKFGDTECTNPISGARWQYMGSIELPGGTHVEHSFRHRDLLPGVGRSCPEIGDRVVWSHITPLDADDYKTSPASALRFDSCELADITEALGCRIAISIELADKLELARGNDDSMVRARRACVVRLETLRARIMRFRA